VVEAFHMRSALAAVAQRAKVFDLLFDGQIVDTRKSDKSVRVGCSTQFARGANLYSSQRIIAAMPGTHRLGMIQVGFPSLEKDTAKRAAQSAWIVGGLKCQ
jgi:hypothetical protein